MKVVFHINELSKWQELLTNVNNLLKATEESLGVEVVANGGAIKGYLDESLKIKMSELVVQNIQFSCCQNAMTHQKMTKEQFFEFVEVVPAGVLRLTELQAKGYGYIKP